MQEGDAMYHIAMFEEPGEVAEHIELMQDKINLDAEVDEIKTI